MKKYLTLFPVVTSLLLLATLANSETIMVSCDVDEGNGMNRREYLVDTTQTTKNFMGDGIDIDSWSIAGDALVGNSKSVGQLMINRVSKVVSANGNPQPPEKITCGWEVQEVKSDTTAASAALLARIEALEKRLSDLERSETLP